MIRAVFFDLDDTLCPTSSTREARARLAHEVLTQSGHEVEFDAFFASVVEYDPALKFIRGMTHALTQLGLHETEAGKIAHDLWFFEGCEHLVRPFDGCTELLAVLAELHKVGVITNGPIRPQAIKFRALGMMEHFHADLFVTSEHAGCFKPDERIFRYALERAGVEPHEAVHVGDSLEADVAGALGAGMRAVWFNAKHEAPVEGIVPDATVTSYAELAAVLEKWSG